MTLKLARFSITKNQLQFLLSFSVRAELAAGWERDLGLSLCFLTMAAHAGRFRMQTVFFSLRLSLSFCPFQILIFCVFRLHTSSLTGSVAMLGGAAHFVISLTTDVTLQRGLSTY